MICDCTIFSICNNLIFFDDAAGSYGMEKKSFLFFHLRTLAARN